MNTLVLQNFSSFGIKLKAIVQLLMVFSFVSLRSLGVSWGRSFELVYGNMLRRVLREHFDSSQFFDASAIDKLKKKIWAEAGFVPTEGKTLCGDIIFKRVLTDRDADLQLGLFTNVSPAATITEATVTEPSGTGYARISLTDASWTNTSGTMTYATQTFTGGTGGWTGSIQGYFVNTNAASGTPRLLGIEVDANGPYTIAASDTYAIDLQDAF